MIARRHLRLYLCNLCVRVWVCARALSTQVDLILLGGDLFHDNTPSRSTVYR